MNNSETEKDSNYTHLDKMSITEIVQTINKEDKTVALAVELALNQIIKLIEKVVSQLQNGGRLFYIGSGTSGRLGIVDASECPPTFGISADLVIGIIAGGDKAIRVAVENAEDDEKSAWKNLSNFEVNKNDFVLGIAASGHTPYVLAGLNSCNKENIPTGCIVCNPFSPIAQIAHFPIEVIVGPEFLTGSTRMKAGTAQKMVLNMISTATMIRLGKVKGNKMIDMNLSNNKLITRAIKMLMSELNIDESLAKSLLDQHGSVRNALTNYSAQL